MVENGSIAVCFAPFQSLSLSLSLARACLQLLVDLNDPEIKEILRRTKDDPKKRLKAIAKKCANKPVCSGGDTDEHDLPNPDHAVDEVCVCVCVCVCCPLLSTHCLFFLTLDTCTPVDKPLISTLL